MTDVERSALSDKGRADSLDLLAEQDKVLGRLFDGWHDAEPNPGASSRVVVEAAWDRGTFGKLLIQHMAVRVAAKEDVIRVLKERHESDLVEVFTGHLHEVRKLLDRLDEQARGAQGTSVGRSELFASTVEQLCDVIQADLVDETTRKLPRIAEALDGHRSELRRAHQIAKEAPTHPGASRAWYDEIPLLARIHARYDHLRGYPWADSIDYANTALTGRIEP